MVGQNVYNKLQGFQTQWTSICTQARRHIESNAATEPLPQTIGWGYHYLLSDGPNRFNKVGGLKPWGFLSFLYSKNLPHPVMAHHTPNLCWQSPESQSVMLRLPKRVIAVASYTQIPRTSPNSGFLKPVPTNTVTSLPGNLRRFFFAEAFLWVGPRRPRPLNPGAFPGASLAK